MRCATEGGGVGVVYKRRLVGGDGVGVCVGVGVVVVVVVLVLVLVLVVVVSVVVEQCLCLAVRHQLNSASIAFPSQEPDFPPPAMVQPQSLSLIPF